MNDTPEIKNAIIESANISISDHGTLDCWLGLDYGGSGHQGFGGYSLYLPKSFEHSSLMSVAGHHIYRILEIAGVEKWSQTAGRTIRVESTWTKVFRIGHIVKDDWYDPAADFATALDPDTRNENPITRLGVGGTYRSRRGDIVTIESHDRSDDTFRGKGGAGIWYAADGRLLGFDLDSPHSLVSQVS